MTTTSTVVPATTPEGFVSLCRQLRELGAVRVQAGDFVAEFHGPLKPKDVEPRQPPRMSRADLEREAEEADELVEFHSAL